MAVADLEAPNAKLSVLIVDAKAHIWWQDLEEAQWNHANNWM